MTSAKPSSLRVMGVGCLISLICYLTGMLVFLTPLPLMYVSLLLGRRAAILTAMAVFAVIGGLYGFVLPLSAMAKAFLPSAPLLQFFTETGLVVLVLCHFLYFAVIGLGLAEGVHRRLTLGRWLGLALFLGLFVLGLAAVVIEGGTTIPLLKGVHFFIDEIIGDMAKLPEFTSGLGAKAYVLTEHREDIAGVAFQLMPSMLFLSSLFVVVMNALLGRRFLGLKPMFRHIHNIASFRLADGWIWTLIAAWALLFIEFSFGYGDGVRAIALNAAICVGSLYFLQGVAVAMYALQGIRIPFFRLSVALFSLFFFHISVVAFIGLGIADVWLDFRNRIRRAKKDKEIETDS
ncbi:MAG: DUF2232 domain-containing protein [Deltaproteobacteria bacterium]|nr:DUF2232 domain-containing protein [Deltaproteobacteria bacterium]